MYSISLFIDFNNSVKNATTFLFQDPSDFEEDIDSCSEFDPHEFSEEKGSVYCLSIFLFSCSIHFNLIA